MYLVLVEKSGAEDGLSSIEIMFYNSFLSLPFLLFLIIVTGEFPNSLTVLFAKVRFLPPPHTLVTSLGCVGKQELKQLMCIARATNIATANQFLMLEIVSCNYIKMNW